MVACLATSGLPVTAGDEFGTGRQGGAVYIIHMPILVTALSMNVRAPYSDMCPPALYRG